jgi:hypothetical protein
MDLRTRRVERDGHEVQLIAGEFEVPASLMCDPGQVLPRELILNAVRGFELTRGPRSLEVSEIEAPVPLLAAGPVTEHRRGVLDPASWKAAPGHGIAGVSWVDRALRAFLVRRPRVLPRVLGKRLLTRVLPVSHRRVGCYGL